MSGIFEQALEQIANLTNRVEELTKRVAELEAVPEVKKYFKQQQNMNKCLLLAKIAVVLNNLQTEDRITPEIKAKIKSTTVGDCDAVIDILKSYKLWREDI